MPLLIAVAPSWGWIVAANVLLGVNQGLAWSMTVVMKIDLVGPKRRGLALGLNEAAGYGGVALAAAVSGWLAAELAPRGRARRRRRRDRGRSRLLLSLLFVRDTARHVALEQARDHAGRTAASRRSRDAFARASYREPALRSCSQAGLVNNLNDALAWGLRAALPRRPRRERRPRSASSPRSTPPSGDSARSPPGTGRTASAASR